MSKPGPSCVRRRFVVLTAKGLVAVPLASVLFSANAAAADMVSESDPKAVALKYKADAAKSADRKDVEAFCDNCNLYRAKSGTASGGCELFGDKLVAARGWCASWEGS